MMLDVFRNVSRDVSEMLAHVPAVRVRTGREGEMLLLEAMLLVKFRHF